MNFHANISLLLSVALVLLSIQVSLSVFLDIKETPVLFADRTAAEVASSAIRLLLNDSLVVTTTSERMLQFQRSLEKSMRRVHSLGNDSVQIRSNEHSSFIEYTKGIQDRLIAHRAGIQKSIVSTPTCQRLPDGYSPMFTCSGLVDYEFWVPADKTLSDLEDLTRSVASMFPTLLKSSCLTAAKQLLCSDVFVPCQAATIFGIVFFFYLCDLFLFLLLNAPFFGIYFNFIRF